MKVASPVLRRGRVSNRSFLFGDCNIARIDGRGRVGRVSDVIMWGGLKDLIYEMNEKGM